MKTCPRCRSTLDLDLFPVDRARKDGRYPYCRTCSVDLTAEWRVRNPEKHRAAQRAYAERNRARNAAK